MLHIGDIKLKSDLIFAPIAGFSDVGARVLCARYGAGLVYTEMVSAKGLCYGNKGTEDLLYTTSSDTPIAVQIFGHEPEFMYRAAKDERLAKFDIVDINMGCPVKKIVGNGDGSALMENPALITEVVQAVKEGSGKPVTVKIRAGVREGEVLAVDCAIAAEKGGADMIAVHPRFREQFYSGKADHAITAEVKKTVGIPVVANGDIVDKSSLDEVRKISGADGFMIARGALGRPWIFAELSGNDYDFDVRKAVAEHIRLLRDHLPDKVVANVMKLQLCHYAKNTGNAKAVRTAISTVKSAEDLFALVDEYFK